MGSLRDTPAILLVGAVGIEPSGPLKARKLFIPRSDKSDKNGRNAEVRYTAGTRRLGVFLCPPTESLSEEKYS
jgi:hypothetical protein